jgi:transcription elongation factor Elf1
MMTTCPNCGSLNINTLELDFEEEENSLMECEDCGDQFRESETL